MMKSCCKDFGVSTEFCLSWYDGESETSPLMKLNVRQRQNIGFSIGQDWIDCLVKVLEYCESTSTLPDNHGDEWAPWSNDPGKQRLSSY